MSNPTGIGGFKKGGDPRIWRFGKPKAFTALRELGQAIAHEKAKSKETGQVVVIDRHTATIGEMIMRSWATSRVPILQKAFIEIAFGKVPDDVKVNATAVIELRYVNNWRNDTPDATPGAADSPVEPGPFSLVDGRPSLAQDDPGRGNGA